MLHFRPPSQRPPRPAPQPTVDARCYVASSTHEEVTETLLKIAERCSICRGPKLHICLERTCTSAPLMCIRCDQLAHRLHRLNELQMLFVRSDLAPSRQSRTLELVQLTIAELSRILENARAIYEEARKLVPSFEKSLHQFLELRAKLTTNCSDGVEVMHRAAEEAVKLFRRNERPTNEEKPTKADWHQCRSRFAQSLKNINLNYAQERLPQALFAEIGREFQSFERLINSFSTGSGIRIQPKLNVPFFPELLTWQERITNLRSGLYASDRMSLLKDTSLDKFVGSSWRKKVTIHPSYHRSIALIQSDDFSIPCRRLNLISLTESESKFFTSLLAEFPNGVSNILNNIISVHCKATALQKPLLASRTVKQLNLAVTGKEPLMEILGEFSNLQRLTITKSEEAFSLEELSRLVRFAVALKLRRLQLQSDASRAPGNETTEQVEKSIQEVLRRNNRAFTVASLQAMAMSRTALRDSPHREAILDILVQSAAV